MYNNYSYRLRGVILPLEFTTPLGFTPKPAGECYNHSSLTGECYEAKIPCSSLCKCMGCKNYTSSHSTLQQLADVAVVRHQQQHAVKQKFNSQVGHKPPNIGWPS